MPHGLHGRLTVTVPEAGEVLGIGEKAAYAAAQRGEIPTLRLGRRLVVPVAKLLELVGIDPERTDGAPSTGTPTATTLHLATKQESDHGDTSPAA